MTSLIIQNLQKTDTYSSNQYFNRDFFATSYSKAIWLSRFKSTVNSASLTKGIFLMKFSISIFLYSNGICLILLDPKTEYVPVNYRLWFHMMQVVHTLRTLQHPTDCMSAVIGHFCLHLMKDYYQAQNMFSRIFRIRIY